MKSYLSPEWSSDGQVHFSLRNLSLGNNLPSLSLAYHLINSPIVVVDVVVKRLFSAGLKISRHAGLPEFNPMKRSV